MSKKQKILKFMEKNMKKNLNKITFKKKFYISLLVLKRCK